MKKFWNSFSEIVELLCTGGILLAVFFDHNNYITDRQLMFLMFTSLSININRKRNENNI